MKLVEVRAPATTRVASAAVEIALKNGRRILLGEGLTPRQIADLASALEGA